MTKAPARERIMDAAQTLVVRHGFAGTSIDTILSAADASKGAFFHHFESKEALGEALLRRYAAEEAEMLDDFMARAENETDDPAEQLVRFVRLFEETSQEITDNLPGCLFVSFVYERGPMVQRSDEIIVESIEMWRSRLLEKLEAAAQTRSGVGDVDLPAVADQVFTTFEGAFILARATGEPSHLRRQLTQLRRYLALLLDTAFDPRPSEG